MLISKSKKVYWTNHSRQKMRYYRLSESRVKRIIHSPSRIEEGIAPKTVAMMQSVASTKNPYELWVMVEETPREQKIISAWRYPGITKPQSSTLKNILQNEYDDFTEQKTKQN